MKPQKENLNLKSKERKELNYYKITTFLLLGLMIGISAYIGSSIYVENIAMNNYKNGEVQTLNSIIKNIEQNQQVTIHYQNQSLTLIPLQLAIQARENTIVEIINHINDNGYVTLYDKENQITLIEYIEPETEN